MVVRSIPRFGQAAPLCSGTMSGWTAHACMNPGGPRYPGGPWGQSTVFQNIAHRLVWVLASRQQRWLAAQCISWRIVGASEVRDIFRIRPGAGDWSAASFGPLHPLDKRDGQRLDRMMWAPTVQTRAMGPCVSVRHAHRRSATTGPAIQPASARTGIGSSIAVRHAAIQ